MTITTRDIRKSSTAFSKLEEDNKEVRKKSFIA
jgi:hypothetical protein